MFCPISEKYFKESTNQAKFEAKKIWYEHQLINDMVAQAMKSAMKLLH